MIKIKKGYKLKVAAILISIVFLCNTSLYACPNPKDTLRVPVGDIGPERVRAAQRRFFYEQAEKQSIDDAARYVRKKRSENGNILILNPATMECKVVPVSELPERHITGSDVPLIMYMMFISSRKGKELKVIHVLRMY